MKMRLAGGRIIKIAIVALLAIPAFECETTEQRVEETLPLTQDARPVRGLKSTKKSSESSSARAAGFLNEDLVDEFEDLFNMVHESSEFSITLSTISYKSSKKSSGKGKGSSGKGKGGSGKGKGGSRSSNYANVMHVENLGSADSDSGTTISKKVSKKSASNSSSHKAEQKLTRAPVVASSDSSRSR
jgi:hypothetical protein